MSTEPTSEVIPYEGVSGDVEPASRGMGLSAQELAEAIHAAQGLDERLIKSIVHLSGIFVKLGEAVIERFDKQNAETERALAKLREELTGTDPIGEELVMRLTQSLLAGNVRTAVVIDKLDKSAGSSMEVMIKYLGRLATHQERIKDVKASTAQSRNAGQEDHDRRESYPARSGQSDPSPN